MLLLFAPKFLFLPSEIGRLSGVEFVGVLNRPNLLVNTTAIQKRRAGSYWFGGAALLTADQHLEQAEVTEPPSA